MIKIKRNIVITESRSVCDEDADKVLLFYAKTTRSFALDFYAGDS